MKIIALTQGKETIVDDNDYDYLSQFKWCYHKGYAARNIRLENGKQTTIKMHRIIIDCPQGLLVDHINGDSLDNRRSNLRIVTNQQNNMNKKHYSRSGFKGVYFNKLAQKWHAQIALNNKVIYLGLFNDLVEAAKAYDKKALELFGEYARLNFIE